MNIDAYERFEIRYDEGGKSWTVATSTTIHGARKARREAVADHVAAPSDIYILDNRLNVRVAS